MMKNSLELHEHLGLAGALLLAGAALLPMTAREDPFLVIGMIAVAVSGVLMLTGKLTDHS